MGVPFHKLKSTAQFLSRRRSGQTRLPLSMGLLRAQTQLKNLIETLKAISLLGACIQ
jgi:hypothetical protein